MKYFKSVMFRFFILIIGAIILPTGLLGVLSLNYFKGELIEQINISNLKTASLLVTNLEYYMSSLEKLTLVPYTNIELLRVIKEIEKGEYMPILLKQLSYIIPKTFMSVNKEVLGFSITISEELKIVCKKYGQVEVKAASNEQEFKRYHQQIIDAKIPIFYFGTNTVKYEEDEEKQALSVVRVLKDYNTNAVLGTIKADADVTYLADMIREIGYSKDTIIAIIDEREEVIYNTHPEIAVESYILKENDEYIVGMNECSKMNWKVYVLSPEREIEEKLLEVYKVVITIMGICLVGASLIYMGVVIAITKPFKKIIDQIGKIEKQGFNYPIEINSSIIEVNILQNALNKMQDKIKEYINREYKSALNERNAQYQALQARINPHFLYNTLGGLMTLNRLGEKELVQQGILALTGMMRYIFESADKKTIGEEVKFLRQYFEVSKIRFEDRLIYDIEIDAEVLNFKVPKLILQPIVENAIVHGLEPSGDRCYIEIVIERIYNPYKNNKNYILISIKDTGVGFDIRSEYLKPGEGLSNIKERIEMAFDETIMSIHSAKGEGTHVVIVISEEGAIR